MQRDVHDLWWGGILALLGLAVAIYAALSYDIGTLRQMGPGFFPLVLGSLLAVLGVLILLPALVRESEKRPLAWREMLAVSASLLVFGMLLDRFGIALTTPLAVLLATSVAPHKGVVWRLMLAAIITVVTWAVFVLALKMPLPIWPRILLP